LPNIKFCPAQAFGLRRHMSIGRPDISANNLREISSAPLLSDNPDLKGGARNWGYIFAAIGTVLFAMKAILVKLAFAQGAGLAENELDTITLLTLRMGFSVPVYLFIGWFVLRRRRAQGLPLPQAGFFIKAAGVGCIAYYACSFLDFSGLKFITAQLERLLLFTYPAFVFILGALFFGKKMTVWGGASIALAYCGIGLIFLGGDIAVGENVVLGSVLVVACAFLFGLSQLLSKPLINHMGSSLYTCAAMIMAGTVVMLHFLTQQAVSGTPISEALDLPARIWLLGAMIALFSTLIPSFFVNVAIDRVGPQAVATIGMLSPIATVIAAIVLLDEPFGLIDAAGTALTIFGIALYTHFDRRAKRAGL